MLTLRKATVRYRSTLSLLMYYRPPPNYRQVSHALFCTSEVSTLLSPWMREKPRLPCKYFNAGYGLWYSLSKCFPHSSLFLSISHSSFHCLSLYLCHWVILSLPRSSLCKGNAVKLYMIWEELNDSLLELEGHGIQLSNSCYIVNAERNYSTLLQEVQGNVTCGLDPGMEPSMTGEDHIGS